jgi:hypothetical protein
LACVTLQGVAFGLLLLLRLVVGQMLPQGDTGRCLPHQLALLDIQYAALRSLLLTIGRKSLELRRLAVALGRNQLSVVGMAASLLTDVARHEPVGFGVQTVPARGGCN